MRPRRLGLPLLLALLAAPALAQPASPKLVGQWAGTLKQGADEMEIVLNIAPADTGGVQIYFDVPSQNIRGFQVPHSTVAGSAITFPGGDGRYEGTVNAAGDVIAGKYIAGNGRETPLDFRRRSAVPVLPAIRAAVEDPDGRAGDFTGVIEAGGGLEGTLHLRRTADGYAATLDIPAQNALGLSATGVALDGDALTVAFPFGTFAGTFSADSAALDGTWTQNGRTFPFDLARQGADE